MQKVNSLKDLLSNKELFMGHIVFEGCFFRVAVKELLSAEPPELNDYFNYIVDYYSIYIDNGYDITTGDFVDIKNCLHIGFATLDEKYNDGVLIYKTFFCGNEKITYPNKKNLNEKIIYPNKKKLIHYNDFPMYDILS